MFSKTNGLLMIVLGGVALLFQNCGGTDMQFATLGSLGVCDGVSCDLKPLTFRPAVTTILLALGDDVNEELVISGTSIQLIVETVVRYSTPAYKPKILFVRDAHSGKESELDTLFVRDEALKRYDVTYLEEPPQGLNVHDFDGYDLVWLNNPGRPMNSVVTRDALMQFQGGVVLQGDDMTRGVDFETTDLTGLKTINNGGKIKCTNETYEVDNNKGEKFIVNLDANRFTGADSQYMTFQYGNDIDIAKPERPDLEILATAKGSPNDCVEEYPTIVRYMK